MKKLLKVLIFTTVLGIAACPLSWALDDAIIAVVNDEVITLKDLHDYARSTYASLAAQGMSEKDLKAIMADLQINGINKIIEDRLMLSHANKAGLTINEKAVDDQFEKIKAGYPSEEDFLKALIDNGANITELKDKIREQLKIKYIVDHEVRSKIIVNPQEVTEYYEKNMEKFQKKERIFLESIFISYKQDKEAALKKADEALQAIQKGDAFADVAKKFSESPSIGAVEKGELSSDIEKIIFALKDNDVSAPTQTDTGVYIFKVTGRMPAETASLKEVEKSITNILFQEKYRAKYKKWLEGLKKNAYIEIKE